VRFFNKNQVVLGILNNISVKNQLSVKYFVVMVTIFGATKANILVL